jgi:NB-ARC domain
MQKFSFTTRAIDESLSRIEKLSKFADRSGRMDTSVRSHSGSLSISKQTSLPEETAKLPCVILPSIRTSRFFDRTDIILKMEEYFNKVDPDQSFRSLTIYGLGGIGKSSIALRFAETKLRKGELDALFWVHSEKLVSIRQSFTDIAMRLKLPDARPGDHEENHALVLNWLQQTRKLMFLRIASCVTNVFSECRWLIVYDNAEVVDLIRAHWPAASRGQALITTRNHSFAFEPADGGLEIKTWDTETGSRFLLHLLSTDIGTELKVNEATSAQELSKKLSGHALAISHMAGLIHRRAWSISEFMKIYNQHPSEMHGVSGNNSINALWDFAFKSLDPQSHAILGTMCFVAPDGIPQSLFEPECAADLPESLLFCSDHLR